MANVVKDIGEIWTRLFDHRPFLSGEINFFLHEFEKKKNNREVDVLFQILQNLTEIQYTQVDKIKEGAEEHLQSLKTKIDDSVTICNRVLDKEDIFKADTRVERNRESRKKEWEVFIEDQLKKFGKVDKTFKEKEDNLQDYYLNLEKNITIIEDPTPRVKPSEEFLKFLKDNSDTLKKSKAPEKIKSLISDKDTFLKKSDLEWLNEFLKKQRSPDIDGLLMGQELHDEIDKIIESKCSGVDFDGFLEEKRKNEPYLHDLLKGSEFILPENGVVERNPMLAERIDRLKKEQEERQYKEMTKNVNTSKKHMPEDTISYQMNMMNRHLIAVAQFLVSVGAGFAFGFLGTELIIGNINFGLRLLLGIACALIIGVAEFYFLAKHLNEEEEPKGQTQIPTTSKSKTKAKLHKD